MKIRVISDGTIGGTFLENIETGERIDFPWKRIQFIADAEHDTVLTTVVLADGVALKTETTTRLEQAEQLPEAFR